MSEVLANSIVVIAIAMSLCYAVWRLGPRKWRDALRTRLRTTWPGVFGNLGDSSPASGCDACSGCAPTTTNSESAPRPARKEHSVFWRKSTR
ncbi:MAG TPA: hypothetical protein VFV69_12720 [Steroidobacteraceae bacterium]|jgi:hypothetical protein|nr:hypothetical protein [Steroidobacteraceae bacterium]